MCDILFSSVRHSFKRLVETIAMLQVAGVYVKAVSNGCLSKLENWLTLTISLDKASLETPIFRSYILFYPAIQRVVTRYKYLLK